MSKEYSKSGKTFQIPKELEFLDEEDERRKCLDFRDHLIKFQRELGVEIRTPLLGGKEIDLCKLYKAVISRGGSQRVSNNKLWKEIVNEFNIPASCTSSSFSLRNHYNKCLLQYEKKFYLGQTNSLLDIPDRTAAGVGYQNGNYAQNVFSSGNNSYAIPSSYGHALGYFRKTSLDNYYQNGFGEMHKPQKPQVAASVNPASKYSNIKKVKITAIEAESKRLVLAFESRITREIIWALNTLTVFSCNSNQNFTLENQPYLLESIANYLLFCIQNITSFSYSDPFDKKTATSLQCESDLKQENVKKNGNNKGKEYPIVKKRDIKKEFKQQKDDQQEGHDVIEIKLRKPKIKIHKEENLLELLRMKRKKLIGTLYNDITEQEMIDHFRMIVVILRNWSFIRANEHHLLKNIRIIDIMISLFIDLIDREITFNCFDFIMNLSKFIDLQEIIWGHELVQTLFYLLHNGENELLIDQTIEILRRLSLSPGNEEFLENIREEDIQLLINLLLSTNIETREGCLEILCTISDSKTSLKVKIAHQQRCIERLIGLIATGSQTPNEEKISKLAALTLANLNLAPSNRVLIVPYEQELALIASSDEKTCKIICEILGDLDSYQIYAK